MSQRASFLRVCLIAVDDAVGGRLARFALDTNGSALLAAQVTEIPFVHDIKKEQIRCCPHCWRRMRICLIFCGSWTKTINFCYSCGHCGSTALSDMPLSVDNMTAISPRCGIRCSRRYEKSCLPHLPKKCRHSSPWPCLKKNSWEKMA